MTAIRIQTRIASTTVHLPELAPFVGHEVEVTVRDVGGDAWPDGWFEATAGAIQDPEFVRHSQPLPESRPSIDL